jgi:hypothetical protein
MTFRSMQFRFRLSPIGLTLMDNTRLASETLLVPLRLWHGDLKEWFAFPVSAFD